MCQWICGRHSSGGRRHRDTGDPDTRRERAQADAQLAGRRNGWARVVLATSTPHFEGPDRNPLP